MPDERMESLKQGIGAAPESEIAKEKDAERRDELVHSPVQADGAMGGTSDADSPGDEAYTSAMRDRDSDPAKDAERDFRTRNK